MTALFCLPSDSLNSVSVFCLKDLFILYRSKSFICLFPEDADCRHHPFLVIIVYLSYSLLFVLIENDIFRLSSVVWFNNSRLPWMKMENLIIILLTCDQFLQVFFTKKFVRNLNYFVQDGMIWIKANIVFLLDGIKWTRSRKSKYLTNAFKKLPQE